MEKKIADQIIEKLGMEYEAVCGLNFSSPFEILIATILSAQCTDVRVNQVTQVLFAKADSPAQILKLGQKELQEIIRPCGLSATKAKNIIATCGILQDTYGGEVPKDFDALTSLPGVGRKTANVVLSNAFGVPAIAVDTHVQRVSNRIGLASSSDVVKTEKMLKEIIDRDKWSSAHHWIIWHGRKVCSARNPKCEGCILEGLCEKHL